MELNEEKKNLKRNKNNNILQPSKQTARIDRQLS
jgi:hypothetical protein